MNITTSDHDIELQDMLDGAVAEFTDLVGPLPDPVPANVRELILADAAGLYSSTQRGGGSARPNFPGEGPEGNPGVPLSLYPRIAAYAAAREKRLSKPLFLSVSGWQG